MPRRAGLAPTSSARSACAPMLGRGLPPEEDHGQGTVAVIGEALWRTRFGADPGILGRTHRPERHTRTPIVGVAPASLASIPGRDQLWLPLGFGVGRASDRDSHSVRCASAGSSPARPVAAAQDDMSAVARALASEYPATNTGRGAEGDRRSPRTSSAASGPRCSLLLGAVGVRAAHRLRQRRQPVSGPRLDARRARSRCARRSAPAAGG